MEIYTARYIIRYNNNTCGLLCKIYESAVQATRKLITYTNYLFWTCPHDQNHLLMPMNTIIITHTILLILNIINHSMNNSP